MKIYDVSIYGTATVKATSVTDARNKASELKTSDWDWDRPEVETEEEDAIEE